MTLAGIPGYPVSIFMRFQMVLWNWPSKITILIIPVTDVVLVGFLPVDISGKERERDSGMDGLMDE